MGLLYPFYFSTNKPGSILYWRIFLIQTRMPFIHETLKMFLIQHYTLLDFLKLIDYPRHSFQCILSLKAVNLVNIMYIVLMCSPWTELANSLFGRKWEQKQRSCFLLCTSLNISHWCRGIMRAIDICMRANTEMRTPYQGTTAGSIPCVDTNFSLLVVTKL